MDAATTVLVVAGAVALIVLAYTGRRAPTALWAVAPAALISVATVWSVLRTVERPEEVIRNRPVQVKDGGYVSSNTCRSCHPRNYDTWHGSFHRSMTQVATKEAVAGRFDGFRIAVHGKTYVLYRKGDEFWVEMDDPDHRGPGPPPRVHVQIVMTTGSHHMQIYWYATGRDRVLGQLPLAYLIEDQRWVPRPYIFLQPAMNEIPLERGRWNRTCIKCHTTHGRPRLDSKSPVETFDSHVGEFGIACEECHGPAEQHVRLNRSPGRRYRGHLDDGPDPSIVHPEQLAPQAASQVCGQCHGILLYTDPEGMLEYYCGAGFVYEPGEELADSRLVVQPDRVDELPRLRQKVEGDPSFLERRFWADGMVRVSGREYNAVVESPCYAGGEFSCLSCHTMHKSSSDPRPVQEWADDQLKTGMDGDPACVQCHTSFDSPAHTHHEMASSGSRCQNCHMPYTTYGLLKAIRSHEVDSPSVTASVDTGRPNACNQCHLDRTLAWAAEYLRDWYDIPVPELTEDERSVAASVLWLLRGDAGQRALMAWSMGWEEARLASAGDEWIAPHLATLLVDPYPAVRYIAHRSLRRLSGFEELAYDYLGSSRHCAEVRTQATERWRRTYPAHRVEPRPAVLIGPDGRLRSGALERLRRQRDDRLIVLSE